MVWGGQACQARGWGTTSGGQVTNRTGQQQWEWGVMEGGREGQLPPQIRQTQWV